MGKQKLSQPFLLIALFKDVWSQQHDGVEYEPDGRDYREAKIFLEIHPDIFEKQETFLTAALRYMSDDFWRNQNYGTNHQFYHFTKNYSKFANQIIPKAKTKPQTKIQTYLCPDCGKPRTDASCTNEDCISNQWKSESGTPEDFAKKLNELTNHMRAQ